jgi:uncharacterized protein YegP (UPF0339 family)
LKGEFNSSVKAEFKTFVETGSTSLTCEYTFKYNNEEIILNEGVITGYKWYKDHDEINDSNSSVLFFAKLNQSNNGNYLCSIFLNNSQVINSTEINMTVYKRKLFSCFFDKLNNKK